MSTTNPETKKPCCEYKDCEEEGFYDTDFKVYLCDRHMDSIENKTGYCGVNCQLGYGCDQSC